jgi:hypothetical protein
MNVSMRMPLYFLAHNKALLYNVTIQIDMLYKCIYKSVSISVAMQVTSLQTVSLSPLTH